jgi:type VI secretion system protein VasD
MLPVRFHGALLIASVLLATGCASVRPSCKVPDVVELEFESSDQLNPDERGRSLPTKLRVYQVTELSELEHAAFDDIWEQAKDTLGPTLVKTEQFTIFPGQLATKRLKRESAADYLVGVAVFRTPVGSTWRTIQEWPLAGDPCQERNDASAAPALDRLRVRMFLENYRIESVNNYLALPKRHCPAGDRTCSGAIAPDELPEARKDRRLRTFEEDPEDPDFETRDEGLEP